MAPTTLPRFSALPVEIRKMVWEMCWQEESRIVYLEAVLSNDSWNFTSQRTLPLLHVCAEAAEVGGTHTKVFGKTNTAPATWFNFEHDTLYLDWGSRLNPNDPNEYAIPYDLEQLLGKDVERVHNLALYSTSVHGLGAEARMLLEVLNYFKNVKNLTWAAPYHDPHESGNLAFLEYSEVVEEPEYMSELSIPFHPIVDAATGPDWSLHFETEQLETMWIDEIWSVVAATHNFGFTDPEWKQPKLRKIPIMTMWRKQEFLRLKNAYNDRRSMHRTKVTLTSKNHVTLELSVPLFTTVGDLVTRFCELRGIEGFDVSEGKQITEEDGTITEVCKEDGGIHYLHMLHTWGFVEEFGLDISFTGEKGVSKVCWSECL